MYIFFCIIKAPQQPPGHAAAQLRQVEPALIDAPLEQGSPVQHHQLLHHLIRVVGGVDTALLLAQRHQLQQHPEVYPPGVFLQHPLLRIPQPVDKRLIQHRVRHADLQGPAHKVQQLLPGGPGGVRQICLLQLAVCIVHMAGHLNGQLILAFEIVIDVAHGASGGLGDLLHGDVFKALPVKQVQGGALDAAAHLQGLAFSCGHSLGHSRSSCKSCDTSILSL